MLARQTEQADGQSASRSTDDGIVPEENEADQTVGNDMSGDGTTPGLPRPGADDGPRGSGVNEPSRLRQVIDLINGTAGVMLAVGALLAALTALTKQGRDIWKACLQVTVQLLRSFPEVIRERARSERALKALNERMNGAPPLSDIMKKYPDRFTTQIELGEAVNRELRENAAKTIVIASGKGGVGKSTLALGLLESYCLRGQTTLIIDFDMHNRGLTSLLQAWEMPVQIEKTSVFKEAERFHKEIFPALQPASESRTDGEAIGHGEHLGLMELMDKFTRFPGGGYKRLHTLPFLLKATTIGGTVVQPKQPLFLPSLLRGEYFLGSEMFAFSSNEVFYFLKFIQFWAAHSDPHVDRIIIDCHGAHDLLMIGAVHAASGLIVAATPEPGAFDGTYDIIAFANLLRSKHYPQLPTVLAVGNCRPWQQSAVEAIRSYATNKQEDSPLDLIVQISSTDDIREITSNYQFGDATSREGRKEFGKVTDSIISHFEQAWDASSKTSPPADPAFPVPESPADSG